MNPDRWLRIRALFDQVADAPPAERERVLEEFAGEAELVEEVRRMLARHDSDSGRLNTPVAALGGLQPAAFQTFFPGEIAAERFRIVRLLGRGGMGEVYEAEDLQLGGAVAVKVLQAGLAWNQEALDRFKRETQLSRRVTHPNVCRVFDLFSHVNPSGPPSLLLSMELVAGRTLGQTLLARGPYSAESALPVLRQIIAGLQAAHEARVVHRDLKASNVLIEDATGRVAVTDFGLARSLEEAAGSSMDGTRVGIGTPAYMAPEQMEGGTVTPATDVYALGVVIFEMVAGRLPFSGGTAMALAVQKLKEAPPSASGFAPDLPAHWDGVIRRCLEYKPEDRFASAMEVERALAGAISASRPRKKWPLAIAAAAALLLAAAGVQLARRPSAPDSAEAARFLAAAETALDQRSYLKARNLASEALKADAGYYRSHARLAQAYVELDQIDLARESILRAATLAPSWWRIDGWETAVFEATQFSVLRDHHRAAARLAEALRSAPEADRHGIRLALATELERSGRVDDALAELDGLTRTRPDFAAAILQQGRLQASEKAQAAGLRRIEEAGRLFELERNSDMVLETRLQAAIAQHRTRRLPESLAALDALIAEAGAKNALELRIRALSESAYVLALLGKYGDAQTRAKEVTSLAGQGEFQILALRGNHGLSVAHLAQFKWKEAEQLATSVAQEARERKARTLEHSARITAASAQARQGNRTASEQNAALALEYFARSGDVRATVGALSTLVDAALGPPLDRQRALELIPRYIKAAEASGDGRSLARALSYDAHMALQDDDFPRACAIHSRMRAAYIALHMPQQVVRSYFREAQFRGFMGQREEAARLAAEARQFIEREGLDKKAPSLIAAERDTLLLLAIWAGRDAAPPSDSKPAVAIQAHLAAGRPAAAIALARQTMASAKPGDREEIAVRLAWALTVTGAQAAARTVLSRLAKQPASTDEAFLRRLVAAAACAPGGCAAEHAALDRDYRRLTGTWPAEMQTSFRSRADLSPLWKLAKRQGEKL